MSSSKRYYGWKPSLMSYNTISEGNFSLGPKMIVPESFLVDIEDLTVYDQGNISSCTANALCQLIKKKS